MPEGQPAQIGRYKILGELGRGGFGRVYRAYDPTVGRHVAIKILTQVSEDTRTRFRNEAMVAGNLGHKNIVTVYEYGTHEDRPFLAMEYLEGQDLHHLIASRAPLTLLNKCNIMSQVADGLYCAHQSGVVHRDMKPANIKVLRDGTVKIMDFGIARLTQNADATRLTQQGFLIGTLRYMAPEQLAGAEFTALCDIFAYGVIYFEIVTGKHPFDAPDAQSLMYKLTTGDPPSIRGLAPAVPPALEQVITRLLQKNPARRYQSLKEVQFDTEPVRIDLQRSRALELLGEAQEHFDNRRYDAAQKPLHEALALEPANRAARALWEQLQRRLPHFTEQARKTSQLLAEARRELEQQNITAAYRIVSEALRQDPKNPEAAEFLKTMQAYVEQRQAEHRVDETIRKALGLLLIPAYDEAISLLTAPGPDADSPRVREFLDRIRGEKTTHERKQKLRVEMAAATDLLREHRFDEAATRLEQLLAEFPEDQDASRLLAYAQKERRSLARANMINSVAGEVRARIDSHDFEAALATLDKALKEYPGESGLVRLLESTLAAKTARESVRQVSERASRLLEQSQPEAALETVQQGLNEHPAEPELEGLLRRAQEAVRALEHARGVGREAQSLADAGNYDAALASLDEALLDDGLQNHPDATSLIRLRDSIAAARDRQNRRQRSLEDLEQLKTLSLRTAANADPAELLARAVKIASQHPDDPQIQSAAAEPIALLSDIARARQELVAANFPAALEICQRQLSSCPDHTAFLELQDEAERGQRRRDLDNVHRYAAAEPDLRKRTLILEEALCKFAGETGLAEELRLARNKLALIDAILERARAYEQASQWDEALEQWSSLHTIYSEYPGLESEIQRVRLAREKALAGALDLRAQETNKKRKRARELLAQAEAASESGNQNEYQTCLRQAFQMDESDAEFRKLVLNKLVDHAQAALQKDWRQAEALVGEATALQPGFTAPGAVLRAIDEGKREASARPVPVLAAPARKPNHWFAVAGALLATAAIVSVIVVRVNHKPETPAVKVTATVASPKAAVMPQPPPESAKPLLPAPQPNIPSKKPRDKSAAPLPTHAPPLPPAHIEIEAPRPGPQVRTEGQRISEKAAESDPKQIEIQEWGQIANSTNPEDFDRFLRNHSGGAHQELARNRAAELRQQLQVNAARQLEQASWDRLDRNNKEQLQDYLFLFPAGAHAQDARARISELDRQAAEIVASAHRQHEQQEQERIKGASEEQAIVKVLLDFEAAYNHRDLALLEKLWSGVPVAAYRQQFREAKDLVFQLQPVGQPVVTGSSATVICTRTLTYRGQSGGAQTHSERVRVTLSREASGWLIRGMNVN